MNPEYGEDYSELCSFSNIMTLYTPAWYYQRFPGFYNVDCYKILANWKEGVRTEEQYQKDIEDSAMETIEEGVEEEMKENIPPSVENKKRKLNSEEFEEIDLMQEV